MPHASWARRTTIPVATENERIDEDAALLDAVEKGGRRKWWRREGSPERGFRFVDADGKRVSDEEHLERVNALAMPPAWRHVRVSPHHTSRLQAVGVDDAGRVQYIYHERYRARREREKYAKIERFGAHLPPLRRVTNDHIALDGFPKERVLAIAVRLMNDLHFRVGSDESARRHKTFGLTTLLNRHLTIERDGRLEFSFKGKAGVHQRRILVDEELADVLRDLKGLGGARIFEYVDEEDAVRPLRQGDVNAYIKDATAPEFSSKDFRTWGGTLLVAEQLAEIGPPEGGKDAKRNVAEAVKRVADELGNTPAVCRASYVHPTVLKCYERGVTIADYRPRAARRVAYRQPEYEPEERALMALFAEHGNGLAKLDGKRGAATG